MQLKATDQLDRALNDLSIVVELFRFNAVPLSINAASVSCESYPQSSKDGDQACGALMGISMKTMSIRMTPLANMRKWFMSNYSKQ